MRYFCTYSDTRYLPRALALYRSLQRHAGPFRLWVLCLDAQIGDLLAQAALPEVTAVPLEEFERGDAPLRAAKENRSLVEYYFTCTASLCLYLMRRHPEIDLLSYVDADLYLFSSAEPLYADIGASSVAIIAHRFARRLVDLGFERVGLYNVGWLSFRNDKEGIRALTWWRERCLEWCYDRVEDGKFGDQKYLDDWPSRFRGVRVIPLKGANLAPWNIENYRITCTDAQVRVDDEPVIFYHFQGLRRLSARLYETGCAAYKTSVGRRVRDCIYRPYLRELEDATRVLTLLRGYAPPDTALRIRPSGSWPRQVKTFLEFVRDAVLPGNLIHTAKDGPDGRSR